jgi:hypothetical protein
LALDNLHEILRGDTTTLQQYTSGPNATSETVFLTQNNQSKWQTNVELGYRIWLLNYCFLVGRRYVARGLMWLRVVLLGWFSDILAIRINDFGRHK